MTLFWVILGVMMLLGLAMVLPPLLGHTRRSGVSSEQAEITAYQERLAELKAAQEHGALTPEQFDSAQRELEWEFLQELPETRLASGERVSVPAIGAPTLAALGVPALATGLYLLLGQPEQASPPTGLESSVGESANQKDRSPKEMVARLHDYLEEHPDDGQGWQLLGRSYRSLGRYDRAVTAYRKAYAQLGNHPRLLTSYADALALANGSRWKGKPTQLLRRALELQPDYSRALWLAGVAAVARGDGTAAVSHWRRLANQMPADSEARQALEEHIAQAKSLASGRSGPSIADQGASGGTSFEVTIRLDPTLRAQAEAGDTVFIFARAAKGPPMPLAVVRKEVADLPTTVTLSDTQGVVPGRRLSNFDEVVIGARISKSGSARPRSGDLQGLSDRRQLAQLEHVEVSIDQQLP